MLRLPEAFTHAQLAARDSFHTLHHPMLSPPIPTAARLARFSSVPDPALRPAPIAGEHTREICGIAAGHENRWRSTVWSRPAYCSPRPMIPRGPEQALKQTTPPRRCVHQSGAGPHSERTERP